MTELSSLLKKDQVQNLSSSLLSTIDERIFFPRLCDYFHRLIEVDNIKIYIVNQDQSVSLISENGKLKNNKKMVSRGEGPAGHVIKTKRSYFSNNTERDPLFSTEASLGIKKELISPILHEGIVIATMHFQVIDKEIEFNQEHITGVIEVLNQVRRPIANMKMYLTAKFLNEALLEQIESKEKELKESKDGLKLSDTYKIEDEKIVGKSKSMQNIFNLAFKVSKSDTNALIEGLPGTGKEMVARKIHCLSRQSEFAFVSVDCTAMDERQLEMEIFGEEIGDMSRGPILRLGVLEKANGGTIFINNIDKMPYGIQVRLSKYISEGLAFRVNGQVPYRSRVRLLAATTKDLNGLVEANEFREDLYFSFAAISIKIPSLKDRKEDIELLGNYLLNKGRPCDQHKSISPSAMSQLLEYSWPGNIREMANVMERAFILSDGIIIEKEHLSENILTCEETVVEEIKPLKFTEMTLNELEKIHITSTLDHLGGNKTRTAKTLGITVKTLYNKLHSYGMIIASKEA